MQKIAKGLRSLGYNVLLETMRRSMKAQMREANRCDANFAVIVGEQENNEKTVQVKNLIDGNQETIDQKNFFNYFKSLTI